MNPHSVPDRLRAFVKRLCLQGRTDREVLAVANQTHWHSQLDEVRRLLEWRGRRWRRLGRRGNAIIV